MGAVLSRPIPQARGAGLLLHPTCLPGPFGVGDLGTSAHEWVDALARAKQTWWQVLPLGPTGYGDSPYSCLSAFAGNDMLVSPELLRRDGLLDAGAIAPPEFPAARVDFGAVLPFKSNLLHAAWERFRNGRAPALHPEFERFRDRNAAWLEDYALFRALKDAQGGSSWLEWDADLRQRDTGALRSARERLADAVDDHRFRQFLFFRQWEELRAHCRDRGLRILGDIPIFVAADSVDVWAHPEYFDLDADRRPRVQAGVPPDYFSATGQLWGNPLYAWDELAREGYAWWVDRLRAALTLVDLVRIDHFRGFEACWEVAADRTTAVEGRWVPGPNAALFEKLREALGGLPILAEDLGLITPEVEVLRDRLGLPGMRVLQFAFGGDPYDRFLPHRYEPNCCVYTGTHDNDTTRGWYAALSEEQRTFLHRYLGHESADPVWDILRLAWGSVADMTFAPLQDVLDLGSEARMNLPGRSQGNWSWRFEANQLGEAVLERLADMTEVYGRAPRVEPVAPE